MHTAQLMPLPLTVSCFTKIQIGFTFLVPAHLGSPGQRAIKRVCVCAAAINQYLLSTGRTAANLQQRVCCCAPMLGQTDNAPRHVSAYYDGSANNRIQYRYTPVNGLFSRTTWMSQYQKGETSLDLNEPRDDGVLGRQRHQLDHMQTTCTSLQTDNHTNISSLNFYRLDALPDTQPTASKH